MARRCVVCRGTLPPKAPAGRNRILCGDPECERTRKRTRPKTRQAWCECRRCGHRHKVELEQAAPFRRYGALPLAVSHAFRIVKEISRVA